MPGVPSLFNQETSIPKSPVKRFRFKLLALLLILIAIIFSLYPRSDFPYVSIKSTHPNFVGRNEVLKTIKKELIDKKQVAMPTVVLWGEGGIGKTETAIAFANANFRKFSGVYWIDCGSTEIYRNSYAKLAEQLSIPFDQKDPVEKIREKVHNNFNALKSSKPWLLIFDNAEEALELPERGNGRIVITARTKIPFPSKYCLQIPYFSDEEAMLLVQKILPSEEEERWKDLVTKFDHFPLALNQVAHYIKNTPGMQIKDCLEMLKESGEAFLGEMPVDYRYCANLSASLQLGMQTLSEKAPEAYDWLAICAYLHPDHIPSQWIEFWLNCKGTEKKDPDILKMEANHLRRTLINQAFMRYNPSEKSLSIHRLKQEGMKSNQSIDQQDIQKQVLKFLTEPIRELNHHNDFEWHHERWEELSYWEINVTWFLGHANIHCPSPDLLMILNGLVNYYTLIKGEYQKALKYFEIATELQRSLYPNEMHPSVAALFSNAGFAIFELGEYQKALKLNQRALEISKNISKGENSQEKVAYMIDIGMCYTWLDRPAEAKKYFEEAYGIVLELFPNTPHLQTAEILKWIAISEYEFDDYSASLDHHLQALEMNRQIYGEKSNLQRAYITGSLAMLFRKLEKYEDALIWNKDAWKNVQEIYKQNINTQVLCSIKDIAVDYGRLKKYKKSIQWSEKGLKMAFELFGEQPHYLTGRIFQNLARVYSESNSPMKAKVYEMKYQENLNKIAQKNMITP